MDTIRDYARELVGHAEAVTAELSKHSTAVQAFMRDAFDLHMYPLKFTQDMAAKLTAFEQLAPSPPSKYSACRICGRGPASKGNHEAIAKFGVHTDANGKPNQPNKGTAYCDQCEDETLVIQALPAVPLAPTPPETLPFPWPDQGQLIARLARLRESENAVAVDETTDPACAINREHVEALDYVLASLSDEYESSPSPGAVAPEGIALKRLMLAYDTEDDFEQLRWQAVARRLLGFKLTEDDADGAEALRANGYDIDADVAALRSGGSR